MPQTLWTLAACAWVSVIPVLVADGEAVEFIAEGMPLREVAVEDGYEVRVMRGFTAAVR